MIHNVWNNHIISNCLWYSSIRKETSSKGHTPYSAYKVCLSTVNSSHIWNHRSRIIWKICCRADKLVEMQNTHCSGIIYISTSSGFYCYGEIVHVQNLHASCCSPSEDGNKLLVGWSFHWLVQTGSVCIFLKHGWWPLYLCLHTLLVFVLEEVEGSVLLVVMPVVLAVQYCFGCSSVLKTFFLFFLRVCASHLTAAK